MSFNVRIMGHDGLVAMKVINDSGQQHSDSVYQLRQPYLWEQTISVSGAAVSSTAVTNVPGYTLDPTSIIRIEVPDGQTIRYEINPPNRPGGVKTASADSPSLSGKDQFQWGAGWTISMVDASGLP